MSAAEKSDNVSEEADTGCETHFSGAGGKDVTKLIKYTGGERFEHGKL